MKRELDIPVCDTVSTAVWKALRMCGVDTRRVKGRGHLFDAEIAISPKGVFPLDGAARSAKGAQ